MTPNFHSLFHPLRTENRGSDAALSYAPAIPASSGGGQDGNLHVQGSTEQRTPCEEGTGWHAAAPLWQQQYLPAGVQEGDMKNRFPSGNDRENFKQAECNYLKWNRTLYPSRYSA